MIIRNRKIQEGNESVTNCHQLKTDVADTKQLFRLVQSIPSPKAEPAIEPSVEKANPYGRKGLDDDMNNIIWILF